MERTHAWLPELISSSTQLSVTPDHEGSGTDSVLWYSVGTVLMNTDFKETK